MSGMLSMTGSELRLTTRTGIPVFTMRDETALNEMNCVLYLDETNLLAGCGTNQITSVDLSRAQVTGQVSGLMFSFPTSFSSSSGLFVVPKLSHSLVFLCNFKIPLDYRLVHVQCHVLVYFCAKINVVYTGSSPSCMWKVSKIVCVWDTAIQDPLLQNLNALPHPLTYLQHFSAGLLTADKKNKSY